MATLNNLMVCKDLISADRKFQQSIDLYKYDDK